MTTRSSQRAAICGKRAQGHRLRRKKQLGHRSDSGGRRAIAAESVAPMSPVKPESPAWPDAAHELQHLLALLEIEQEADRKRFEEELEAKSLAERVASGAALDRLSFSELRSIVGGRYRLRLSHASAVRRRVFQSGQPAMLAWRRDEAQWQRLAAIVVWASERELEAVVEEFPEFDESCELALWRRFDQSAYEDMRRALQLAIAAKDADFRWLRDGLLDRKSVV